MAYGEMYKTNWFWDGRMCSHYNIPVYTLVGSFSWETRLRAEVNCIDYKNMASAIGLFAESYDVIKAH